MNRGCIELDDSALLDAFLNRTLTEPQWDHAAHLRNAVIHVREHGVKQAVELLRKRIPPLNDAHGVPNSDSSGYHETITVAWARILGSRIGHCGDAVDSRAFLEANEDLMTKRYLQSHYTTERLMSVEARRAFLEPDVAPLP